MLPLLPRYTNCQNRRSVGCPDNPIFSSPPLPHMPKISRISGLVSALLLTSLVVGCGSRAPRKAPSITRPAQQQQPHDTAPTQQHGSTNTAPKGGVCDAQPAQWAVGKKATGEVVEQARVRAGARMARVLHPNQVTTLELRAERLNLHVDGSGKILSADCG